MNTILANIIATGDSGKPLLVAICLIVSIVLMVVLIMVGKGGNGEDDESDEEEKAGNSGEANESLDRESERVMVIRNDDDLMEMDGEADRVEVMNGACNDRDITFWKLSCQLTLKQLVV